jgi:hypothetical protein
LKSTPVPAPRRPGYPRPGHQTHPGRLEAACAKAIAVGDSSYRTIKGILHAGVEIEPAPPGTRDGGAAAHLRGPSQLFANVIPLPSTSGPDPMDPATTSEQQQHGQTVA